MVGGALITNRRSTFEAWWPEVARDVSAWLRARGFSAELAEDALQETAVKAFDSHIRHADAGELCRWAKVVSRNVAIDLLRRQREVVGGVPERSAPIDVEETALDRVRMSIVTSAIGTMSETDRGALRRAVEGGTPVDRATGVRHAVQLHRARARLSAMVKTLIGWLGWLRVRRRGWRGATTAVALPGTAIAIAFLVLALSPFGTHPETDRALGGGVRAALTHSTNVRVPTAARPSGAIAISAPRVPGRSATNNGLGHVVVRVPRPDGGGDIELEHRPKRPSDKFLCSDTVVAGYQCVNIHVHVPSP